MNPHKVLGHVLVTEFDENDVEFDRGYFLSRFIVFRSTFFNNSK